MGDTTTHDRLVRQLVVGAQTLVVFVDYDRSPEARYPIAIEEGHGLPHRPISESARLPNSLLFLD